MQNDVSLTYEGTCLGQVGISVGGHTGLLGSGRRLGYVEGDLLGAGGFIHERGRGPARSSWVCPRVVQWTCSERAGVSVTLKGFCSGQVDIGGNGDCLLRDYGVAGGGLLPPSLTVRSLKKRWNSFSRPSWARTPRTIFFATLL